jgi:hypothetical protein
MTNDSAPENAGDNNTVTTLRDTLRELQARHEKTIEKLSNPTEEMMLAGALAHNAGLRPMRTAITAGEAKNIFIAMIAAMKESH